MPRLHVGPQRRPFRRAQLGVDADRVEHRDHRLGHFLVVDVAADRRVEIDRLVVVARSLDQLARLRRIVGNGQVLLGVFGVVAVLARTDRPVEPVGLALQHVLDDEVAIDGVAHRLAQLEIVPRLVLGTHRQEHDLDRARRMKLGVRRAA